MPCAVICAGTVSIDKVNLETGLDTAEATEEQFQIPTWRDPVRTSQVLNWEGTVNYPLSNWSFVSSCSIIAPKEMPGQRAPGPLRDPSI